MPWVHHYDLIVLEGGVLTHPVRVQHPQSATPSTSSLLHRADRDIIIQGTGKKKTMTTQNSTHTYVHLSIVRLFPKISMSRIHELAIFPPNYMDKVFYNFLYLGNRLYAPLKLELVHTLVGWLAVSGSLGYLSLTTSSADTNSVQDEPLLGLVAQSSGLIRSGGPGGSVDAVELSVLPTSHPQ